jgi:hypothetical protein
MVCLFPLQGGSWGMTNLELCAQEGSLFSAHGYHLRRVGYLIFLGVIIEDDVGKERHFSPLMLAGCGYILSLRASPSTILS